MSNVPRQVREVLARLIERHEANPDSEQAFRTVDDKLDLIIAMLTHLIKDSVMTAQSTEALRAAVERNTSVDQSIIMVIQGLAQKVADLGIEKEDPEVQQLADQIMASANSLAAAAVASTPAAGGGGTAAPAAPHAPGAPAPSFPVPPPAADTSGTTTPPESQAGATPPPVDEGTGLAPDVGDTSPVPPQVPGAG